MLYHKTTYGLILNVFFFLNRSLLQPSYFNQLIQIKYLNRFHYGSLLLFACKIRLTPVESSQHQRGKQRFLFSFFFLNAYTFTHPQSTRQQLPWRSSVMLTLMSPHILLDIQCRPLHSIVPPQ